MENTSVPVFETPKVIFKKAIGAFDPRAHSKAGRAEKNNSTLLFQRTLFGKGSIPQEDVKQLTLVSAIKTITDVISSYTTGKENIK